MIIDFGFNRLFDIVGTLWQFVTVTEQLKYNLNIRNDSIYYIKLLNLFTYLDTTYVLQYTACS